MKEVAAATPVSGDIALRFLALCQFRRLGKVQLDIDCYGQEKFDHFGLVQRKTD